jgi:hypothetical protein
MLTRLRRTIGRRRERWHERPVHGPAGRSTGLARARLAAASASWGVNITGNRRRGRDIDGTLMLTTSDAETTDHVLGALAIDQSHADAASAAGLPEVRRGLPIAAWTSSAAPSVAPRELDRRLSVLRRSDAPMPTPAPPRTGRRHSVSMPANGAS